MLPMRCPCFHSASEACKGTALREGVGRSVHALQLTEPWQQVRKVKAQHEGALPPPCIVRKDPRVPHTARRGA